MKKWRTTQGLRFKLQTASAASVKSVFPQTDENREQVPSVIVLATGNSGSATYVPAGSRNFVF